MNNERDVLRLWLITLVVTLILIGLVLWWSRSADAACLGHIVPGQPDNPLCEVLWLTGVRR